MMKIYIILIYVFFSCCNVSAQGYLSIKKNTQSSHVQSGKKWYNIVLNRNKSNNKKTHNKKKIQKTNNVTEVTTTSTIPSYTDNNRKKYSGSDIFKKYNNAVFMILTKADKNIYQGSGFFINSSGLAVSNVHVFENAEAVLVKKPGYDKYYVIDKVYYYDKEADFILFHVNIASNTFIPIAESSPSVGDKVYAIGSPKGLENTFASGEVSQKRGNHLLQISIPIDHGSSGGALLNEQGEVVGITVGGYESSGNLNFAIDIDVIRSLLSY